MEVGFSPDHIVLDSAPPAQRGTAPWIFGPGDVVLDMNPSPPKTGGQQPLPHFSAHILWSNGYMDVCCVWYGMEVGLGPGDIVLDGDPAPPKGAQPPIFQTSIVAKRSPIAATAELLLNGYRGFRLAD